MPAQRRLKFTALPQVKSFERLVDHHKGLGSEQADRQQKALPLALRKHANAHRQEGSEAKLSHHIIVKFFSAVPKAKNELQAPPNRLLRPRSNSVRHMKQCGGSRWLVIGAV